MIIHTDEGTIFVECKHQPDSSIGRPVIQKLHSAVISGGAIKGIVVTTGSFSMDAIEHAKILHPPIELMDRWILLDLAIKAGIELVTSFKKGKIYNFLISDDVDLLKNICIYLHHNFKSIPNKIEDYVNIDNRIITLIPIFRVEYSIDSVFQTTVGVIHSEKDRGVIFIDGTKGDILNVQLTNRFLHRHIEEIRKDTLENNIALPYKCISGLVMKRAINYIIKEYSKTITYVGGNYRRYYKHCIPKSKDIYISDVSQVYIPENYIHLTLFGRKRHLTVEDNGSPDLYLYHNNISTCEICNHDINKKRLLCNVCGSICHDKKLFKSHSFYCKECGMTICRTCAKYIKQLFLFKRALCPTCGEKYLSRGKTLSKYKRI